jgi:hypothetical protein
MRHTALLRKALAEIIPGRIRSFEHCLRGGMRSYRPEASQVIDLFGFLAHLWAAKS